MGGYPHSLWVEFSIQTYSDTIYQINYLVGQITDVHSFSESLYRLNGDPL